MTVVNFFFNYHNNVTDFNFTETVCSVCWCSVLLEVCGVCFSHLFFVASVFGFNSPGFIGIFCTCPQMDLLPVSQTMCIFPKPQY